MSYILDALKKSERQRPPGPVPDLFTVQGPEPPSPPRRRRLGIAAGCAAAGLIAGWAWFGADRREDAGEIHPPIGVVPPSRQAPEQLASPPAVQPGPAPSAEAPLRDTPRRRTTESARPAASPRPPAALPPAAEAARTAPAAQAVSQVDLAPVASSTPEAAAPSQTPPASPIPPQTASPAAATPPVKASDAATPTAALPAAAPPAPEAVPAAPAVPPEELPPADGRVLDAAELPAPVRAELPQLAISGHVWSEEPSLRLLTVGDRILREGAEAAPGVRLEEITMEGAVFAFKGWRYRVGGFRP